MDSNTSGYLLNHTNLHPVYYQAKEEDDSIIDLGLSLRALQPEAYHPSGQGISIIALLLAVMMDLRSSAKLLFVYLEYVLEMIARCVEQNMKNSIV